MIHNNNNLTPLPWYSSVKYQNANKSYAYGNVYPLIAPIKYLLPFQIVVPYYDNTSIYRITLINRFGNRTELTDMLKDVGCRMLMFKDLGYRIIFYPAILPITLNVPDGQYYMEIGVWPAHILYSEVFTIVSSDINNYLKIEWYDDDRLYYADGHIDYRERYRNTIYLCSQLGKPDYQFEQEGEDRDGYFFPEKQISQKIYKFNFLAPEYLCDALRVAQLSDHVIITSNGISYECDTFLITPKWQTQGDLASVEAEFTTDTVIKKIGMGRIITNNGDFNDDFNNDYNNQ